MSEELLRSLLSLFAIISNADGKLDEAEISYINSFMEDYLGKEYAKKYRRLFIKYFHYSSRQPVSDETLIEICDQINHNLNKKQKIVAMVRLLEISVFNDDYVGSKRSITSTIANHLNIDTEEFTQLENFVYATQLSELIDHNDLVIYTERESSFTKANVINSKYLNHTDVCFFQNDNADIFLVKFLGNDNEIFLNFNSVKHNLIYVFYPGSNIKIGNSYSLYFSDISSKFTEILPAQKFIFNAIEVTYKFKGGEAGLDGVSISEEPGRLVAIMGGSGSGKTTLLNILSGIEPPYSGAVKINHIDLNSKDGAELLKGFIGYVAQDDILIESLTVFQNLYYNAQLCFKGVSDSEITSKVNRTLKDLGIYKIRNLKVGNYLNKKISGGQRKRLNIALELIREPSILFLDEPTSGLSSRDSENVMDFLKQLTYKGKLIITVIHQPSADVYKMFDRVIIMDDGGSQIYYGNPIEAIRHFKSNSQNIQHRISSDVLPEELVNPELIFNIVEEEFVDENGNYTGIRKFESSYWKNIFKKQKIEIKDAPYSIPEKALKTPNRLKQFLVFLKRDLLSKLNNKQYILINLLEAPVLALVLALIIRYNEDFAGAYSFSQNDNIAPYIFISVIVSLFMGMTVSAGEIIKDKRLLKREQFLHLSRWSYLGSKITILFFLSAIQTLTFVIIANNILELKDMNLYYCIMLFSTSCFANIIGLIVSSTLDSSIAVYIAIPLLLIPQMILSGAVFSYDKLNKVISSKDQVPILADLMVSRWAYEALVVHQYKNNRFQRPFFELEQRESNAYYKHAYWGEYMLNKANMLKLLIIEKPEGYHAKIDNVVNLLQNELINDHIYKYDSENFKLLRKGNYEALLTLIDELEHMKEYYGRQYHMYNKIQDHMVENYIKSPEHKETFMSTRSRYFNYSINDLVRNKNSKFKIQEIDNRLVQKIDPIYRKSNMNSKWYEYRTHFYCAEKKVFGIEMDTFWANCMVIWTINIISFILLYINAFALIISKLESLKNRFK